MSDSEAPKITVQSLLSLRNSKVRPIEGLVIPNITVPPHLESKKRIGEENSGISVNIRQLFNSLTAHNIPKCIEQLLNIIIKAQTVEMIEEVAQEMLNNFIKSEQNIKNYIHLLNSVSSSCIFIPSKKDNTQSHNSGVSGKQRISPTIGNCFLTKCRDMIFSFVDASNIRKLAEMDQDDVDELDEYNRRREQINNLITTICYLYEQRHSPNINLSSLQLYPLISGILAHYQNNLSKMKELGDPYEDCSDEEEYEILRKMCILYAEQLCVFMTREAKNFAKDKDIVRGQYMSHLIERFKSEVVPTLTEQYLVYKCQSIEY